MPSDEITIVRASIPSLSEAVGDGGGRVRLTRRRYGAYAMQIARTEAFEARVGGELAAIGGFFPDPELGAAECWFLGGPALKTAPRAALDAVNGVLDAAGERFGLLAARVCAAKSLRFVRLLGFAPTALAEGGYRWVVRGAV